jgi:HAD superfamily hydrolase (TIGR01549 family)
MLRAILFDLDDTLLGNDTNSFVRNYFGLLSEYAQDKIDANVLMKALLVSSQQVMTAPDLAQTNFDQFWQVFCPMIGLEREDVEPFFNEFYGTRFQELEPSTVFRPAAPALVAWCLGQGIKVVVATNPVFPEAAIRARLRWAGVPVEETPFALVTTMENSWSTKPHASYYQTILDHIDCHPSQALMVGDDLENDIRPAAVIGCYTFWVNNDNVLSEASALADAIGTLEELHDMLLQGWPLLHEGDGDVD